MGSFQYLNYFGTRPLLFKYFAGAGLLAIFAWMQFSIRSFRLPLKQENELCYGFPFMMIVSVIGAAVLDALFTGTWRTWGSLRGLRVGFTYTGWLLGAILFLSVYGRWTTLGSRFLLNCLLPSFALAQAIGRVGCFVSGCCYGRPCAWGLAYPEGSFPYSQVGGVPLFPVQLVEALALTVLFFVCIRVEFRRRGGFYLVGVGLIRLVLEFFRADDRGSVLGQTLFSPQQVMSLVFMMIGAWLMMSGNPSPKEPVPVSRKKLHTRY